MFRRLSWSCLLAPALAAASPARATELIESINNALRGPKSDKVPEGGAPLASAPAVEVNAAPPAEPSLTAPSYGPPTTDAKPAALAVKDPASAPKAPSLDDPDEVPAPPSDDDARPAGAAGDEDAAALPPPPKPVYDPVKPARITPEAAAPAGAGTLPAELIATAKGSPDAAHAKSNEPPRGLKLILAVGWEGRDLLPHNLDALKSFRAQYPDVPLVHFVSPAYFLRPGADAGAARAAIRTATRPGDRVGLALGGWKSLSAAAGVIFRSGPTFWGHSVRGKDCEKDCGEDVPVHVYPEQDLEKLVQTGLATLEKNGFGRVKGLQTAGWVASPQVLEAAARSGIRYDFSAVPAELLMKRAYHYPLYSWVKGLWPTVTPHTQPYVLPTQAAGVTEIPDAIAAVDYLTSGDIVQIFKEYLDTLKREPGRDLTFTLAVYQETAKMQLPVLLRAMQQIKQLAAAANVTLAPMELPGMELPPESGVDAVVSQTPAAATPATDAAKPAEAPKSADQPLVH